jgi:hypothetical protein
VRKQTIPVIDILAGRPGFEILGFTTDVIETPEEICEALRTGRVLAIHKLYRQPCSADVLERSGEQVDDFVGVPLEAAQIAVSMFHDGALEVRREPDVTYYHLKETR